MSSQDSIIIPVVRCERTGALLRAEDNPPMPQCTNDRPIQLVDWLGLALELEAQAKQVESKSAMRAMYSAARGLRLMGGEK